TSSASWPSCGATSTRTATRTSRCSSHGASPAPRVRWRSRYLLASRQAKGPVPLHSDRPFEQTGEASHEDLRPRHPHRPRGHRPRPGARPPALGRGPARRGQGRREGRPEVNAPAPDPELVDDDGTEAEALAPVEVPRHPERPAALRPRWSQAGYASV